ncbi:MAG: hypothetical protein MHM6MM_002458, partial [Cercozoa sp. M6MM]
MLDRRGMRPQAEDEKIGYSSFVRSEVHKHSREAFDALETTHDCNKTHDARTCPTRGCPAAATADGTDVLQAPRVESELASEETRQEEEDCETFSSHH